MTTNDPFGGSVDPLVAANGIGRMLSVLHSLQGTPSALDTNGGMSVTGGIGPQAHGRDPFSSPFSSPQATTDTSQSAADGITADIPDGSDAVGLANPSIEQGYGHNGHPGIDLGVPVGTPLIAAETGTVTAAGNTDPNGYGNEVEITAPDGTVMRYGHLSAISVTLGQQIKRGQSIGKSGGAAGAPGSGNSSGPHLHFEVRQGGKTVDPTPFLAGSGGIVKGSATSNPAAQAIALSPQDAADSGINRMTDVLSGKASQQSPAAAQNDQQQGEASDTGNFAEDILKGIGAPVTSENVRVIEAWMRAEGGASHNNPLNTTQDAPGASNFNDVGVKTYSSYQQGVQATIQTLLNGLYGNIIDALKRGNSAKAVADAIAASPWGTGGLVQQIVAGK